MWINLIVHTFKCLNDGSVWSVYKCKWCDPSICGSKSSMKVISPKCTVKNDHILWINAKMQSQNGVLASILELYPNPRVCVQATVQKSMENKSWCSPPESWLVCSFAWPNIRQKSARMITVMAGHVVCVINRHRLQWKHTLLQSALFFLIVGEGE